MEIVRPSIKTFDGEYGSSSYSILSANYYLSGKYEISPALTIIGEIPFCTYSYEIEYTSEFNNLPYTLPTYKEEISGDGFGNPYIGIEAGNASRSFYVEAGVRIPVVDEYSMENADQHFAFENARSADAERIGAFLDYYLPLKIVLNYYPIYSLSNVNLKLRGGLLNLYSLEPEKRVSNYSLLLCSAMLSYRFPMIELQAGWGGVYRTGTTESKQQTAYENATISVNIPLKKWDFGLALRWPLTDNVRDKIGNVIHIGASYHWQ